MNNSEPACLQDIYQRLSACFGPQHWWPGETSFEIIVGAILTQSAAWTNVEKAISKLKEASLLNPSSMLTVPQADLAELIYSCGYHNVKARKLLSFANWIKLRFEGNLEKMLLGDALSLRKELLGVYGIGEETADAILLYAANKAVFVIDAYTRRVVDRMGLPVSNLNYSGYQDLFMRSLPPEPALYNEYHALLVALGKNHCLKTHPLCDLCCLKDICDFYTGQKSKSNKKLRLPHRFGNSDCVG